MRRNRLRLLGCVGLIVGAGASFSPHPAGAQQQPIALPDIYVGASRLGGGIVGASTTTITAEDLARSPGATLQDLLSEQPGIQVQNLFGGVNGANSMVDMRGFGAAATSNTLVLINGRRLNDVDMAGVDFSSIPRQSIERIEITRGNAGAVLYGDGAMGGVINIITKSGVGAPPSASVNVQGGTFDYRQLDLSATASSGPFASSAFATGIDSNAYRDNNRLQQRDAISELRYTGSEGNAYFNISADDQRLGLPGGRVVTPTSSELVTDPRGAATPFDHATKRGLNATIGVVRDFSSAVEAIVDGGVRYKKQLGFFFSDFGDTFVDTDLTTWSLTPRVLISGTPFGVDGKTTAGIDVYKSIYGSDRAVDQGDLPNHHYDINQLTAAAYVQQSVAVLLTTTVSAGLRIENNSVSARDRFDPSAPANFPPPQGLPLDKSEMDHAFHVGIEQQVFEYVTLFGRMGQSFRFPNVDERVGQGPFGSPTTFDLRTQKSRDYEGGFRFRWGRFNLQSSIYDMRLTDEIFFSPATFTNVNLDPTHRYGSEHIATWQITDTVRLKGSVAYTRAVFRAGDFAGKDVPLVSRWTESVGLSWNIWGSRLVFDGVVRFVGPRRMDNDSANVQPLTPNHALVDLRVGGEIDRFNWSIAVQNLFNVHYFDYAIASLMSLGTYNAYPQPGTTVLARAGVKF